MSNEIWTEKYRPKDFRELVGQKEVVKRTEAFVINKNMPHLLFAGPAGTGKSSLSLIIVKKLFGKNWHDNYLELNASDERGIDIIRQKVKNFARTMAIADVPFKIIFLDEADALTKEAQHALRRTMENYSGTCRFILGCNFSSKIIDPIQSRCTIFRFTLLNEKDITKIIENVAKTENLNIDSKTINTLYEVSGGDCRRIINILQASVVVSKNITDKIIYEIVAAAQPTKIKELIEIALTGDFVKAREKLLDIMLKQGLSGLDIIKSIQKEIWNLKIPDNIKVALTEKTGEIEFRMVEGADEFIQLEALLASFIIAGKNKLE